MTQEMKNILLPSLSLDGWVGSTAEKSDYLLSHFFLSEKSQTALYTGHVASLPGIIQQYKGDMIGVSEAVRATLYKYFSRYFYDVTSECTYETESADSSKVALKIFVSFTDSTGHSYTLGRLATLVNSKIEKIVQYNNTGVLS